MNINYLIQLLGNRLSGLNLAKSQAFQSGDLERINAIDIEILEVQNTLTKLNLLASVEQTAASTSFTETQIVQNGIEASFNPTVINDATKCLLEFNIEPYATDPDHEMKIQGILERMPLINTQELIDIYLKKASSETPLTGQMIINSSSKYNVDARLMLAIMELDSRFGTEGIGARTFNPGNVGNNGVDERNYNSWDLGVDAVASWLNNHRRTVVETPVTALEDENYIADESDVSDKNPDNTDEELTPEPPQAPPVAPEEPTASSSPIIEDSASSTTSTEPSATSSDNVSATSTAEQSATSTISN